METINVKHMAFTQYNAESFKKERDALFMLTGQTSKRFNSFVRDAVYFFYHEGNHQVNIINEVLKVAHQAKGFDHSRLLGFLENVIPHKAHQATKGKDKGTGKEVKQAPRFGAKDSKKEYKWEATLDFLALNPHWGDWGREVSSQAFSVTASVHSIALKLVQNGIDFETYANALKAEVLIVASKKSKKIA